MKTLIACLGLTGLAGLLLANARLQPAAASPAFPLPQDQTISCSSDDMRRHTCEADTRGGVQLVHQRSEAACLFGRTWGFDDRGIWVDRGCRADFQLGAANWTGWGQSFSIYCASDENDRTFCPTDTSNGVRLVRQRSGAECLWGRSWGYNRRGIWVDHGCRADFELGSSGWSGGEPTRTTACPSDDMGLHFCPADTGRGVRLIRQRSDADCIYGHTWGYDDRGIWVDRGCRADFELGGGDNDNDWDDQPYTVRVHCASDDMRRHTCYVDTRGGVRLVKKRSEADCIEGRTWGSDRRGIWVDRGCRAEFEVASGGSNSRGGTSSTIYCASDDMHRHTCPADTRGGVRLTQQKSGSPCIEGRTWGYNEREIWVDRGCRADFEVVSGGSYSRGGPVTTIYCASDDMHRHTCPADTRGGVRLLQQKSGSECIESRTWGYNEREIWVDRGCRADFQVGGGGSRPY